MLSEKKYKVPLQSLIDHIKTACDVDPWAKEMAEDLLKNQSQVICLSCFRRWISARPIDTRLDELECPDCHQQGIAIETGETSVAEELLKQMKEQEGR